MDTTVITGLVDTIGVDLGVVGAAMIGVVIVLVSFRYMRRMIG